MLKQNEMTRKEIVAFLKLNMCKDSKLVIGEIDDAVNDMLEHLIDEFGDPNLAYNTDTGYFDYIGPELPA